MPDRPTDSIGHVCGVRAWCGGVIRSKQSNKQKKIITEIERKTRIFTFDASYQIYETRLPPPPKLTTPDIPDIETHIGKKRRKILLLILLLDEW